MVRVASTSEEEVLQGSVSVPIPHHWLPYLCVYNDGDAREYRILVGILHISKQVQGNATTVT